MSGRTNFSQKGSLNVKQMQAKLKLKAAVGGLTSFKGLLFKFCKNDMLIAAFEFITFNIYIFSSSFMEPHVLGPIITILSNNIQKIPLLCCVHVIMTVDFHFELQKIIAAD